MAQQPVVTATAIPGNADVTLLDRARALVTNALITQATVSSIAWAVVDLDLATTLATGTFSKTATVFDSLQTDTRWTKDSIGYNFKAVLPAANFPVANSGNRMRADVKFTMVSGEVFRLEFEWPTLQVYV